MQQLSVTVCHGFFLSIVEKQRQKETLRHGQRDAPAERVRATALTQLWKCSSKMCNPEWHDVCVFSVKTKTMGKTMREPASRRKVSTITFVYRPQLCLKTCHFQFTFTHVNWICVFFVDRNIHRPEASEAAQWNQDFTKNWQSGEVIGC